MKSATDWQDEAQMECGNKCLYLDYDESPCEDHQVWGIRKAQADALRAAARMIVEETSSDAFQVGAKYLLSKAIEIEEGKV